MTRSTFQFNVSASIIVICLLKSFSTTAQPFATKQASSDISASVTNHIQPINSDITQPTLFLVPYSHLDDVWRWSYPQVIRDFLKRTLDDNFAAFEAYPDYVFNWSGASRYQMIKEYYPEKYTELKKWVAAGRWYPSGSSWVENDVNVPSSESNIRQLLMGTQYFEKEFGKESREFMLPDCFGFPYSLPSVLHHCGIRGFSTQKLTWESANGIPFNVGHWTGPDGKWVIAALNAGDYSRPHKTIYPTDKATLERLEKNRQVSGLPIDYYYMGGGDQNNADRGGAVQKVSLETLTKSLNTKGPVKVVAGRADAMFTAISNEQAMQFPNWNSELQLIKHSTGVLTSQAYTKKINRDAELLADASERAAVASFLLTGSRYPQNVLNQAWGLVLRNQFHDNLPGTSIPKVYEHSWNDGIIALNQFAGVYQDALGAIAQTLQTDVPGVPLVVFNPLSVARTDHAESFIPEVLANAPEVAVFDAKGVEVPSQLTIGFDGKRRILFKTNLPPIGAAVYSLCAAKPKDITNGLLVKNDLLENEFYRVKIDKNGDISSIFDKQLGKEILEMPIQLEFGPDFPDTKPAWRIYWKDIVKPARSVAANPVSVKVIENGPLRVAIEIVRENEGSKITQRIQLSAGADGRRVETVNQIDWKSRGTLLKAAFHLTANAPEATYNLGLGTIQRGNRTEKQYEVSHHSWFDLTDKSGDFGVSILSGAKYGSDKVDDNTLRLTLLHTPDTKESVQEVLDDGTMSEMRWQDWGRHEFRYALASHKADWRKANTQWEAMRFEQRPAVFEMPRYKGGSSSFSLMKVSDNQVNVQTVKLAEDGSGVVVRMQELHGQACRGVKLTLALPILAAEILDGVERRLNTPLATKKGVLTMDFQPYELKTILLKFNRAKAVGKSTQALPLNYDTDIFSCNNYREDGYDDRNPRSEGHRGTMDGKGGTYPAEMIEDTVRLGNVAFAIGPRGEKQYNAVACLGQTINLPAGTKVLHILAAADVDTEVTFTSGGKEFPLTIGGWTGYLGQWDNREFDGYVAELSYSMRNKLKAIQPAYIRNQRIAWAASHHHRPAGDALYEYSYLFAYRIEIPENATSITLPDSRFVRIVAMSVGDEAGAKALQSPFEDLQRVESKKSDFTSYIDPRIGNVAQFLVPTYPTFHLPNQQLRMFPVKPDYLSDQVTAWPLQVVTHREAGILKMKVSLGEISNKTWNEKMTINHDREVVRPWHYSTYLLDDEIAVSFAPAAKSAVYKFEFPENKSKNILISGTTAMKAEQVSTNGFTIEEKYSYIKKGIKPDTTTMTVYCYGEISSADGKPITTIKLINSTGRMSISLSEKSANSVQMKYAISYISTEQAKYNFSNEI
ncbi:MAG: glycoside hydrolase family 38 C-terminal domain-containing protein, partial [Paludibacter sp.]|nr:glycoside hydrolase family 38 C-terminal domain-containing protein [Paludibacter sp.]